MTKANKRWFMIGAGVIAAVLFCMVQLNLWNRQTSELTVTEVDANHNCIYAAAKNALYDTEDRYIIPGASDYLKGQVQLAQIEVGDTIRVVSNGKVLLSDPYQFEVIYRIDLQ